MSCSDCDYCPEIKTCKYAFKSSSCLADDIKAAKFITASDYFTDFYDYVMAMERLLVSDELDNLVYALNIFKQYAEMEG